MLLPATTALETLSANARRRALRAGANVIMPNVTPFHYRSSYEIYPNKASLGKDMREAYQRVTDLIESEGRTVGTDPGHSRVASYPPSLEGRGGNGDGLEPCSPLIPSARPEGARRDGERGRGGEEAP